MESVSSTVELACPSSCFMQESKRARVSAAAIPGPTARVRYDLRSPSSTQPGAVRPGRSGAGHRAKVGLLARDLLRSSAAS